MIRLRLDLLLPAAVGLMALGCQGRSFGEPGGGSAAQVSVEAVFQSITNRPLDILFVVDDTGAASSQQSAFAAGFPVLARVLESLPHGPPSLHVGFVPASGCGGIAASGVDGFAVAAHRGRSGTLRGFQIRSAANRAALCGLLSPSPFLRSDVCGQVTNFPGALEDAFSCLADFGAHEDCASSQPFAAIERTLGGGAPGWEGFLRAGASLVIVIVTASEDASGPAGAPDPVAKTVDFLRGLKADPQQVLVSVIGPADCLPAADPAAVPPRLRAFTESFASNGLYLPVCANSFAPAFTTIATKLAYLRLLCLGAPVRDFDPATPGIQAECAVTETAYGPDGSSTTTVLPRCDRAAPPCWELESDPTRCIGGPELSIQRAADYCPEFVTTTHLECVGCPDPADPTCARG